MTEKRKKGSILSRLRNYFFAGAVVLIPIGITLYLSLFIIKVSTKLLPKELNPNNYSANVNLGTVYLSKNNFKDGWKYYEHRLKKNNLDHKKYKIEFILF